MLKILLIFLIRFYQKTFSRVLPAACKYEPSCSQYAIDCLEKYGLFVGVFKAACRVLRCNPFSRGGYDPA